MASEPSLSDVVANLDLLTNEGDERVQAEHFFFDLRKNHPIELLQVLTEMILSIENENPEDDTRNIAAFIVFDILLRPNPAQEYYFANILEFWEAIPEEGIQQITNAALRGLVFESHPVRNYSSHILSLILCLNRGKSWNLFQILKEMIESQQYPAHILASIFDTINLLCNVDADLDYETTTLDPLIEIISNLLQENDFAQDQELLASIASALDGLVNPTSPPHGYSIPKFFDNIFPLIEAILEKSSDIRPFEAGIGIIVKLIVRTYNSTEDPETVDECIPYNIAFPLVFKYVTSENDEFKELALNFFINFAQFELTKKEKFEEYQNYQKVKISHIGNTDDCKYPRQKKHLYFNLTAKLAQETHETILSFLLTGDPEDTTPENPDMLTLASQASQLVELYCNHVINEMTPIIQSFILNHIESSLWTDKNSAALAMRTLCMTEMARSCQEFVDQHFDVLLSFLNMGIPKLFSTTLVTLTQIAKYFRVITDERLEYILDNYSQVVFDSEPLIICQYVSFFVACLECFFTNGLNIDQTNIEKIIGYAKELLNRDDAPVTPIFRCAYDLLRFVVKVIDIKKESVEVVRDLINFSLDLFQQSLGFGDESNLPQRYDIQQSILQFIYQSIIRFKLNLSVEAAEIATKLFELINSTDWNNFSTPYVSRCLSVCIKYAETPPEDFVNGLVPSIKTMLNEGGPADVANAILLLGRLIYKTQADLGLTEILQQILDIIRNLQPTPEFIPPLALGFTEILNEFSQSIQNTRAIHNEDQSSPNTHYKRFGTNTDELNELSFLINQFSKEETEKLISFDQIPQLDDQQLSIILDIFSLFSDFPFSDANTEDIATSNNMFRIIFIGYSHLINIISIRDPDDFKSIWNLNKRNMFKTVQSLVAFSSVTSDTYFDFLNFMFTCIKLLPKKANIFLNRQANRIAIFLAESQSSHLLKTQANTVYKMLVKK